MFKKGQKIYFVGIGGIGMSALASILSHKGLLVLGSDLSDSKIIAFLKEQNIEVFLDQKAENIVDDIDLVVHSLAIGNDHPELVVAKNKGIKIMSYPEALGALMKEYRLISVCGTHGKSTSTAMLSNILIKAKFDPSIVIGTTLPELDNKNFRVGKSDYFLAESCEYKEAFLNYDPEIILITNIDPDHLDYYKTEENYLKAFEKYIWKLILRKTANQKILVVNGDDINIKKLEVIGQKLVMDVKYITFGEKKNNDFYIENNDIYYNKQYLGAFDLKVAGKHNRINALGAFALAYSVGIEVKTIIDSLNDFKGSSRRLEYKGKNISGALIYDDYAHHPKEIKATLQAVRELYPKNKIIAVFQPHQFSRTKFFLAEFGESFFDADEVIIPNIYKVRDLENDINSVSAEILVSEISKHHINVSFGNGLVNTAEILNKNTKDGDVIVVMGAGDVGGMSPLLLAS